MNILFVTYDFPYPTDSGGKNRAYHLIKHTASKANIFLFSFVRDDYNPDHNEELKKIGVKGIKVVKRKKLGSLSNVPKTLIHNSSIFKTLYFDKNILADIIDFIKREKIEVVHFESSYTGYYIGKELKKLGVKQVLGTENIEFRLYFDYAKSFKKAYVRPFISYQADRLKKEELDMVQKADSVTTITQEESDFLKVLAKVTPLVVANGIEPSTYSYKYDRSIKKNILFVGNFSYFPNVEAIEFFYKEAFPKLRDDITLTIIGKKCTEKFNFEDKRIIMKDFVEDIISEYRNADILVFPIRIGGGTNFKVLEAMSLGVPIIAQPERLSGLRAKADEHFLSAISGQEYADQINVLYADGKLREKIAVNARMLIDKYYSWEKIGHSLLNVWTSQ
jgi:glycosyltransferase involved in cell wall biosynthesis